MERMIAVGGGASDETLPIEQETVRLAGGANPNALFIPTASNDHPGYIAWFQKIYGTQLGCNVDNLLVAADKPTYDTVAACVRRADLIYIGQGGNLNQVFDTWRSLELHKLIAEVRQKAVLAGSSAGAICWFEHGYYQPTGDKEPELIEGFGLIPGIFCAHYRNPSRPSRVESLKAKIKHKGDHAIALRECTAFIVEGAMYRIMISQSTGCAYHLFKNGDEVEEEQLGVQSTLQPLDDIYGWG